MKTKGSIISALIIVSLVFACKKKDSTEDPAPTTTTGTTTGAPVVVNLTYAQSIGSVGSALSEFNFNMSGGDMSWGLATDGNFVYVADFGNNCVKKIDLSTNTVAGWYGFKGTTWGYYTDNTTAPSPLFKPTRLIYKNNNFYAFAHKGTTGKSTLYKFNTNGSSVDTSKVIPVFSFFTADIDANENVIIAASDSVKVYTTSGVTRFGGTGTTDGKLNNSGYMVQVQAVGDTIVVIDAGNSRIQKFSSNGSFISKFEISLPVKDYTNLFITDNKYYFIQKGNLAEYSPGGTKLNEYPVKGNPSGFGTGQKQFIVINNKVIFQDNFTNKLHVFTK